MNDYQDTPTVIGSRGGNRGTTNAAAIKAAKRSGEAKVDFSYAMEFLTCWVLKSKVFVQKSTAVK